MSRSGSSRNDGHDFYKKSILSKIDRLELQAVKISVKRRNVPSTGGAYPPLERSIDDPAKIVPLVHVRNDLRKVRFPPIFGTKIKVNQEPCHCSVSYEATSKSRSRSRSRSPRNPRKDRSRSFAKDRHIRSRTRSCERSKYRSTSKERERSDEAYSRNKYDKKRDTRSRKRSRSRGRGREKGIFEVDTDEELEHPHFCSHYSEKRRPKNRPPASRERLSKSRERSSKSRDRRSKSRERRCREKRSKSREKLSKSRDRRSNSRQRRSKSKEKWPKSRDKRSRSRERRSKSRGKHKSKSPTPLKPGEYRPGHPDLALRYKAGPSFRRSSSPDRSRSPRKHSSDKKSPDKYNSRGSRRTPSPRGRSRSPLKLNKHSSSSRRSRTPSRYEKRRSRTPYSSSRSSYKKYQERTRSPRDSRRRSRSPGNHKYEHLPEHGFYEGEYWIPGSAVRPGFPIPRFYPPAAPFYPRGMVPGPMIIPRVPIIHPAFGPYARQPLPVYNSLRMRPVRPQVATVASIDAGNENEPSSTETASQSETNRVNVQEVQQAAVSGNHQDDIVQNIAENVVKGQN